MSRIVIMNTKIHFCAKDDEGEQRWWDKSGCDSRGLKEVSVP